MRPPRQFLLNDRSYALFKASRRDSLRLVPEVAMAAAAESLPALGVSYRVLHQRQTVWVVSIIEECSCRRDHACGALAKSELRDRLDLIRVPSEPASVTWKLTAWLPDWA